MLAYAANRPVAAARRPSPNAMLAIIVVHVAALAAVMSVRMELPPPAFDPPTRIDLIRPTKPPPPNPIKPHVAPKPIESTIDRERPIAPTRPDDTQIADSTPRPPDFGALTGSGSLPGNGPQLRLPPIRLGPQLATAAAELRPPYPSSKLATEEEAVLRLRLTIDERGRVTSVEPVGLADPTFLAAAKRHLLAHWRYKPASVDGRAVASTAVITLRFQLDG